MKYYTTWIKVKNMLSERNQKQKYILYESIFIVVVEYTKLIYDNNIRTVIVSGVNKGTDIF